MCPGQQEVSNKTENMCYVYSTYMYTQTQIHAKPYTHLNNIHILQKHTHIGLLYKVHLYVSFVMPVQSSTQCQDTNVGTLIITKDFSYMQCFLY